MKSSVKTITTIGMQKGVTRNLSILPKFWTNLLLEIIQKFGIAVHEIDKVSKWRLKT